MSSFKLCLISGLYYKPIMIVNDNSSVINLLETSLIDDAIVIIYDRYKFIVQAKKAKILNFSFVTADDFACFALS